MNKKITIIGAGAIGLLSAYYLIQKGFEVCILDKKKADEKTACSFGNAGMIAPSHFMPLASPGVINSSLKWLMDKKSPLYIQPKLDFNLMQWLWKFYRASNSKNIQAYSNLLKKLNLESKFLFEKLNEILNFDLESKGIMMLFKTEKYKAAEIKMAQMAQKMGLETQILSAKEVQALQPNVNLDVLGGVLYPQDAHLNPEQLMQNLKKYLIEKGVTFHFETKVLDFRIKNKKIESTKTNKGDFQADEFLIAAGSWTQKILQKLKIKILLQAGKGYSLSLKNPKQQFNIPAILAEKKVAITPFHNKLRFAGTMEIAGLNLKINSKRIEGIQESIKMYLPDYQAKDFENIKPWAGLRPCSPDGLPYLGRSKKIKNLSISAGHAMLGISLAPISGKLISEILAQEKTSVDVDCLAVERFF